MPAAGRMKPVGCCRLSGATADSLARRYLWLYCRRRREKSRSVAEIEEAFCEEVKA